MQAFVIYRGEIGGKMTKFEEFISGSLLCQGVVSGAALITRQGQLLYSYGQLLNISQEDIRQFMGLFGMSDKTEDAYNKDFKVILSTGVTALYTAHQKTYSSIYATSKGSKGGLTVCNLPYGLLICVYPSEVNSGNAIKCIEAFCDLLRR